MLRYAHFDIKGGMRTFAAGASQPCLDIGSRHSSAPDTGFLSASPHDGSEPIAEEPNSCCVRSQRGNLLRRGKTAAASQREKQPFMQRGSLDWPLTDHKILYFWRKCNSAESK
jgi:hypothetical protein